MTTPDPDDAQHRREIVMALCVFALFAAAIWLADAFYRHVKLEECFEAGHRNCAPIEGLDNH